MSSLASQAHAFHQPVDQRLSWLHHWNVPHVHTCGAFSPSEWGPNPQCQATQVVHWIWWWQCLAAWHCRSVWLLPYHFAADVGGLALSMAKSYLHGALRFAHKSCTSSHVSWKRGGRRRELVAAPWTSSRRFSYMLWLKVHSHRLLRACLLGSKRKLPPPACQVWLGLPSVVCHPRGMQFPGTLYICNHNYRLLLILTSFSHLAEQYLVSAFSFISLTSPAVPYSQSMKFLSNNLTQNYPARWASSLLWISRSSL